MAEPAHADPTARPRRVAIIGVHGVGQQAPGDTAQRLAGLLQRVPSDATTSGQPGPAGSDAGGPYTSFGEERLTIAVHPPPRPAAWRAPAQAASPHGPFHEWVSEHWRADQRVDAQTASDAFMAGQVADAAPDQPPYDTVRLSGQRRMAAGPDIRVDVYEAYWADLSQLGAGIWNFFGQLYQLLFHLPSLGLHVVDAEAAAHPRSKAWERFRKSYALASGLLTADIPVLNLLLLGLAGLILGHLYVDGWSASRQLAAGTAAVGLALVAAWGGSLWLRSDRSPIRVWRWLAPPAIAVVLVAASLAVAHRACATPYGEAGVSCRTVAAVGLVLCQIGMLALVAAGIGAIAWALDARHPGTLRRAGWYAALALPAGLAVSWHTDTSALGLLYISVRTFELVFYGLMISWAIFFSSAILAWAAGSAAVRTVTDPEARQLASNSRMTARLLLSLSTLLLIVTTIGLWATLAHGTASRLESIPYRSLFERGRTLADLATAFVDNPGTTALPTALVLVGLAALPVFWGFGPSVFFEVRPPSTRSAGAPALSRRLGGWMTDAFAGLGVAGRLLYATTTFVLPALALLDLLRAVGWSTRDPFGSVRTHLQTFGAVSGIGLLGLFAFRGRIEQLALGLRPVLDILLEVDNWLRERPADTNPKALITSRFTSLLRHVCRWRDRDGHGYDGIIIVAHSQGTVIAADLLRLLQLPALDRDPSLQRLTEVPVILFTMGSPLRALYGNRFPRFYGWAHHEDCVAMADWAPRDLVAGGRLDPSPDPMRMGVALWANAYRSGDYVGRYLWRTPECAYLWTPDRDGSSVEAPRESNSTDGTRRLEFCIGAGAHTHYWDETAGPIGLELDRLVVMGPFATRGPGAGA